MTPVPSPPAVPGDHELSRCPRWTLDLRVLQTGGNRALPQDAPEPVPGLGASRNAQSPNTGSEAGHWLQISPVQAPCPYPLPRRLHPRPHRPVQPVRANPEQCRLPRKVHATGGKPRRTPNRANHRRLLTPEKCPQSTIWPALVYQARPLSSTAMIRCSYRQSTTDPAGRYLQAQHRTALDRSRHKPIAQIQPTPRALRNARQTKARPGFCSLPTPAFDHFLIQTNASAACAAA